MDAWSRFQPVLDRIIRPGGEVDISSLSETDRNVFWAWSYQIAVENGGHASFFYNSSGEFAKETIQALCDIGAMEFGAILAEAVSLFPNKEVPRGLDERNEVFESLPNEASVKMSRLDERFFGIGGGVLMLHMARYAA